MYHNPELSYSLSIRSRYEEAGAKNNNLPHCVDGVVALSRCQQRNIAIIVYHTYKIGF